MEQVGPGDPPAPVRDALRRLVLEADGGVDLYLVQHTSFGRLLTVVDCKRNRADRPVKVEVVRQMLGTIEAADASAGVLATTSRFTSGAMQLAKKYPSRLGLQDYFGLHSMLRNAAKR